jgi:predicted ATPase
MDTLRRLVLKGFKSIRAMDLELRPLNVLIGANGAGKSNLISFFKLLNEMMGERLQTYIAGAGRAHSLLHYTPKVTRELEARLEFDSARGLNAYDLRLFYAAVDTLFFADETLTFTPTGFVGTPEPVLLGAGHQETRISTEATKGRPIAKVFRHLLVNCRVYHFQDTSQLARYQQYWYIGNDRPLLPDAGNLAAVLFRLRKDEQGGAYHRIVDTIRLIAPFFDDFVLEPTGPNARDVILNWRERQSDEVFGPHQLSDGTVRAICLVTLLLQPEVELPGLIIVDEPELGLHPYAINVIASLLKKASHHRQVLVSTQSSSFLDNFEPSDVIIAEREGKESVFTRPDASSLESWLEEYSLGEIWEKNVIGGGPH